MAEVVNITGTEGTAKIRHILTPALLPIITLGIYFFYWWYQINREMVDYGRAKGTNELGDSPGKVKHEGTHPMSWAVELLEQGFNPARHIEGGDSVLDEGE